MTLFDRTVLDIVSFARLSGQEVTGVMETAIETCRFNKVVFVTPPWREIFRCDEERKKDFETACAEYEALVSIYSAQGHEMITIPRAGIADRANFVEQWLETNFPRQHHSSSN